MEGARALKFRPYWIRYIVTFWAGEKLKWARDNILVACLCSLAPGLIATGMSAALSANKWRAATYATLLTYAGLFALFLTWRLVSTPFELDRERQRFINGLTKSLAHTKFKLAKLQARCVDSLRRPHISSCLHVRWFSGLMRCHKNWPEET
jgi:hypothetical protein